MRYQKIINTILLSVSTMILCVGCEDTDYMTFDITKSGVYFTKDTLNYSFSVTPIEITSYDFKIPVRIMGTTSEKSRPIPYRINPDSTTAVEGMHYNIKSAEILPDSIDGYIEVEILRNNLEGDYKTGYTKYKLCIELVTNDYFTPTLDSARQVRILRFDNAIEQPAWYSAQGEKVWNTNYLGEWHPYKFIKMVEYFHAIENIHPETYKNMVQLYGENLEHIEYGNPWQYRTIFTKYIYQPMFEFFDNPANYNMIYEEYNDFPFDFPDPYAQKDAV